MNRVFDDACRGFGLMPFGSGQVFDRAIGVSLKFQPHSRRQPIGSPNIEVSETDNEVKVTAEVRSLEG